MVSKKMRISFFGLKKNADRSLRSQKKSLAEIFCPKKIDLGNFPRGKNRARALYRTVLYVPYRTYRTVRTVRTVPYRGPRAWMQSRALYRHVPGRVYMGHEITRTYFQKPENTLNKILWVKYFGKNTLTKILWLKYFEQNTLTRILWITYIYTQSQYFDMAKNLYEIDIQQKDAGVEIFIKSEILCEYFEETCRTDGDFYEISDKIRSILHSKDVATVDKPRLYTYGFLPNFGIIMHKDIGRGLRITDPAFYTEKMCKEWLDSVALCMIEIYTECIRKQELLNLV